MEVNQAIRKLLFLEDCVIIPGLGGFVSRYLPAAIIKDTGTFIPPVKEIVFNPELVQNDGTLVNFLADNNRIPKEAAREKVDLFVYETIKLLDRKVPVFIEGIGQFTQDHNRVVRFQTDPGTNLFTGSYGLPAFHMREIAHDNRHELSKSLIVNHEEPPRTIEFKVPHEIHTNRGRTFRRIAIAMPILIAFSLLPVNFRISGTLTSSPASMVPEPSLFRLNYPDAMQREPAKVIIFPIRDTVKSEEVASEAVTSVKVTGDEAKKEAIAGKFPVIAGCFKIRGNAERLHKDLTDKGYPATIIISRKGLFKVSVESFATRQDAFAGLARLKRAEPDLQLWVAL